MERSEVVIYLNSSAHSSKSENVSGSPLDGFINDNSECNVIKLHDFISDNVNVNEDLINNMDFGNIINNLSFTSSNSSIIGKSYLHNERDISETGNNDLRSLFCHIITKLDDLEDQLKIERKNYELMKNKYDQKFNKQKITNKHRSDDIDDIFDDLYSLDTRVVHCEQYSRRESVVISGIPDNITQQELEPIVLDILNRIGLHMVTSYQISACHRLFKKRNNRFPAKTIVKFTNRKIAEFCFQHGDRLYQVSEHFQMNLGFEQSLCEANRKIIKLCKELSAYGFIKEYRVIRGSIRITKTDETRQYKIKNINEMYTIFKDYYDFEDLYLT